MSVNNPAQQGTGGAAEQPPPGWVALVGAGPGDEGLLTIHAAELLGAAQRGVVERAGLDPAASFEWIWAALEREIPRDNTWAIHFITHQRATAEVIVAGISRSGVARALRRHGC